MTADKLESLRLTAMNHYGFGTEEMKKTKVCVFCGTKLSVTAKICTECGKNVPKQTLFDVYKQNHICCKFCDTVLADNARFCPQCGHKVNKIMLSFSEKK